MKYGIKVIVAAASNIEPERQSDIVKTKRGVEVWYKQSDSGLVYTFDTLNDAFKLKEQLNVDVLFPHATYLIEEMKD